MCSQCGIPHGGALPKNTTTSPTIRLIRCIDSVAVANTAMLEKILSGRQTRADQAAWRAANAYGIATGGWMPKGFLTEEGPRPEFAVLYAALEMPTSDYPSRTEQNVRDSHATLWFGTTDTPGAKVTIDACERIARPHLLVIPGVEIRPSRDASWLSSQPSITVLNIAGNRESKASGIGRRVEHFLLELFRQLGHHKTYAS